MSVGEQFMPRVDGKPFRCACGCNVFHKNERGEYVCNVCKSRYAGEPVCAVCGHEEHVRACGVSLPEYGETAECGCFNRSGADASPEVCRACGKPYAGWTVFDGARTYEACATPIEGGTYQTHPFEPAPPSSEEAEAQATAREQQEASEQFKALTNSRRPLGEWDEITHARFAVEAYLQVGLKPIGQLNALENLIVLEAAIRRPIEEERDRLRERVLEVKTLFDVLARNSVPLASAEAAEAQVQKLMAALEYRMSWIHDLRHGKFNVLDWTDCPHLRCEETRRLMGAAHQGYPHQEEGEDK